MIVVDWRGCGGRGREEEGWGTEGGRGEVVAGGLELLGWSTQRSLGSHQMGERYSHPLFREVVVETEPGGEKQPLAVFLQIS